jgi:tetratricopeptide (TPR) repeat protein
MRGARNFVFGLILFLAPLIAFPSGDLSTTELNKKISVLKRKLEKSPNDLDLHYSLGVLYYKRGDLETSVTHLKKTNEVPNVKRLKYLVQVLRKKGDSLEEVRTLNILSKETPHSPNVFTDLGNAYIKIKQFDEAIKNFRFAIEKYPKHRPAYEGMLEVFRQTKNAYELRALLMDMLSIFGKDKKVLTEICSLDYLGGFLDNAVTNCQFAIEVDPSTAENHVYLALTFRAQQNEDRASKILLNAAKQFPKSELALIEAGKVSERNTNWEAASKYYSTCTKNIPKSVECYLGLGRSQLKSKAFQKGIDAFLKACELDRTKFPELLKAMGDLRVDGFESWSVKFKSQSKKCGVY